MGQNLFALGQDAEDLLTALEAAQNDGTDEGVVAAIDEYLAEKTGEINHKLNSYAAVIETLEARGKARAERAKRQKALADSDTGAAKRMRERLREFFVTYSVPKTHCEDYTLNLQAAGGKLPLVVPEDARELPEAYRVAEWHADKDAIRLALETGETIDGCAFGERPQFVSIR